MSRTVAVLASFAAACAVVRPVKLTPPPPPPSFVVDVTVPTSGAPGAAAAASTERATRSAVWWNAFSDPALDGVIQEALRNNYFIRDVRTLIYENALDPATPRGWLWPLQIGIPATTPANIQHVVVGSAPFDSVDIDGKKTRNPATQQSYNAANIDITATYQVDVWGNLDAQRRVADDLVEQQRQNTEGASQNLAEQVTQLWFDVLVQRALKELTEGEVKYNEELFGLVKARFEQHLTPRLVVLQQEQQLLNIRSQVPLIAARIAMLNSQLTGLLGRLPNPRDELIPADRRLPDLPPEPRIGTPADLVDNTSEMRLAKLRVTEIENRINQNLSSWLPTIDLVASTGVISFGSSAETFRESFAGIRLIWPIFDGGRRMTEAKQLDLTLKRRKWQYDLAIKTAIGRVQDALLQEKAQAESLRSLRGQIELGRRVLDEARRLFEQGQSDYLQVLNALSSLASLERSGLQAQRLLLTYRVQLYRALGGTWSYDVTTVSN
jgi:multidrug efflux system outer membrane protein